MLSSSSTLATVRYSRYATNTTISWFPISSSSSMLISKRLYSHTITKLAAYKFDRPRSSSSSSSGGLQELYHWPITSPNTILNIVPQGQRFVVERLGRLSAIHDSGYFFAIPFIDRIAYVIDMRERAIDILPQSAITRDNVSVEVSGNLFVQVVDPSRAAYGARNPLYSVMQVWIYIYIYILKKFFFACTILLSSPYLPIIIVHTISLSLHLY